MDNETIISEIKEIYTGDDDIILMNLYDDIIEVKDKKMKLRLMVWYNTLAQSINQKLGRIMYKYFAV